MNTPRYFSKDWLDGFAYACQWMSVNPPPTSKTSDIRNLDNNERILLDAIHDTLRYDLGMDPELIYEQNRKMDIVFIRSSVWCLFQQILGCTQMRTAKAFRNSHSRINFVHMKDIVNGQISSSEHYQEIYATIHSGVTVRYLTALSNRNASFTDINLPSGTRWSEINVPDYHDAHHAADIFKDILPTKEQAYELINVCRLSWDSNTRSVIFKGPSGKKLTIPALGFKYNGEEKMRGKAAVILLANDDNDNEDSCSYLFIHHHNNTLEAIVKTTGHHSLSIPLRLVRP